MINMKRIDRQHVLMLDTSTDKSHMFSIDDFEYKNPILTFDSDASCTDAKGVVVCRLSIRDNAWVSQNSLGIVTDPVSFNKCEGIFDVEAQFCKKWLELATQNA